MAPPNKGTTTILVKAGQLGSDWKGFLGSNYFEVWNVSFTTSIIDDPIPIPATAWLFGSGLIGVARRERYYKSPFTQIKVRLI